jgi:phage tail-like protein
MPVIGEQRRYCAGRYAIELDSVTAGWIHSAEGGHASADVVVEKPGPDRVVHKHIAGVKYEDITVTCGTGMSKSFYEWLTATFDQKGVRKNGAIITADYEGKEVSRLSFYNALITEIDFPAPDASTKDMAKMAIKMTPEYTRRQISSGASLIAYRLGPTSQQKWLPSNFRLTLAGLDCTRVNKIDAITVKQQIVENPVGESRDYENELAYLEIPNLVVTLPESYAQDFYDWHADFVINGNNGQDNEKNGTLEFLTPNLQGVLFSLTLKHLGIFKLSPENVNTGDEAIRRVRAEMYCEEMQLAYFEGAVGSVA